jgi:bla regulator protein blaR1
MKNLFCLSVCLSVLLIDSLAQDAEKNQPITDKMEFKIVKPTPLYILNGIELKDSLAFTSINPDDIEKMEVLNQEQGATAYGKRGINGVVIVVTKAKMFEATEHIDFLNRNPLVIVDDVELKEGTTLSSINSKDVNEMHVLKDKLSIHPYGEKGKNGVVIITTKNYVKKKSNQ